jgi:hypothetical protein
MSVKSDNANKEFIIEYDFDGKWTASVWAYTYEEAEMKLRAMANGTIQGVLAHEIRVCRNCGQDWTKAPHEQ